jgi:hypothetical protein
MRNKQEKKERMVQWMLNVMLFTFYNLGAIKCTHWDIQQILKYCCISSTFVLLKVIITYITLKPFQHTSVAASVHFFFKFYTLLFNIQQPKMFQMTL